ncbi:MAG: DEAD/DEAH box helicase, partial [Eubacteriales bacterium]
KTVAFGIPAIQKVDMEMRNSAQILIMCPTRELAMQACGEIDKLSCYTEGIRAIDIYGGAPMQPQITGLKSANIVIGTPGRIMDHLRRRTLKLHNVKMVVLDEADEMLSMGFRDDIETILNETPEERQTVLFSATMPKEILALTKKYQKDPQTVSINAKQITVDSISQFYYEVPSSLKKDALDVILKYHNASLSLIFCNTRRMVDEVVQFLNKRGHCAEGLHGEISQPQRTKIMEAFKHGKTAVLVATDVAARGIDVKNIEYVINFDIPQNTEYYVHRIGRTGRAGSDGCAITLCSGRNQVSELMQIGRQAKSEIKNKKMPTSQEITTKQYEQNVSRVVETIQNTGELSYKDMVSDLVGKGYDPLAVAAAALEMCLGTPDKSVQDIVFENPTPVRRSNEEFR